MAVIDTGSVYQFRICGQAEGQNIINRFWWVATQDGATAITATEQGVFTQFIDDFRTVFLAAMSERYTVWRYELRTCDVTQPSSNVNSPNKVPRVTNILLQDGDPTTDKGAVTGSDGRIIPTFNFACRTGYNTTAGRGNTTKNFIGPILASWVDTNSKLTTGAITALNTAASVLDGMDLADVAGVGFMEQALLRWKKAAAATGSVILKDYTTKITRWQFNPKIRSIRRRVDILRGAY